MTLPHDSITQAVFAAAAAAAAHALGRPITNAADAHQLAVAEALVLDQFDSPDLDLAEALALQEALEHLVGYLAFGSATRDVRLDFELLVSLVQCEATARQAALRAGFWPTPSVDTLVWANSLDVADGQATSSLWFTFDSLQWTGRKFTKG